MCDLHLGWYHINVKLWVNLINYQIKGVGVGENQDRGLCIILLHSIKMYFVLYSMVKGLCFDLFQGLCILLEKNMLWSSCQNRNLAILVANSKFSFCEEMCFTIAVSCPPKEVSVSPTS